MLTDDDLAHGIPVGKKVLRRVPTILEDEEHWNIVTLETSNTEKPAGKWKDRLVPWS